MTLIEQAALRLEQLRKAGLDVSGELSQPSEPASAPPDKAMSVVELAAQRMRALNEQAVPDAPAPAEPDTIPGVLRRHPRQAATQESLAAGRAEVDRPQEVPKPEGAGTDKHLARRFNIDFDRLAERGLLTPDMPQSRIANEFRVAKRPLLNNCIGKSAVPVENARRIMVTSALPGEGKSYASLNLAMSIAMERDSTVLLVEGDPTRPSLATLMGLPPSKGLIDLLVNPGMDVSDVLIRTNLGRLSFIPAGTRHHHSTELLASKAMENLVNEVASRYEDRILIFDSPPILAAPEPRVLARYMGQIVFVIEAERTSQSVVLEALDALEACPVVMTLLNKTTSQEAGYYYYYGAASA
jgi:receptor protein-tyrosine kinase